MSTSTAKDPRPRSPVSVRPRTVNPPPPAPAVPEKASHRTGLLMLVPVLVALVACCGLVTTVVLGTSLLPQPLGIPGFGPAGAPAAAGQLVAGKTTEEAPPAFKHDTPGGATVMPQFTPPTAFPPPATPTATPAPTDSKGVRINDAKISDQQVVNGDGKTFVTRLTFALSAAHFDGLWAEIEGDPSATRYNATSCTETTCTFEVTLTCSIPARTRATFHSGIYWRYTTFTLTKPSGCGS